MKTIEIKGWIWAKPQPHKKDVAYEFSAFDYEAHSKGDGYCAAEWATYKKIGPHTIVVEVPSDIDPVALMIAGLEAERTKVRAELTRRIKEINDQISNLTAIEYKPATVVEPVPC